MNGAQSSVYPMRLGPIDEVRENIADRAARAAHFARKLKFGYRVHVRVRDSEEEARVHADRRSG
ncbi:MAG: hypothetical protein ABIU18_09270 [Novosphingobium sp.]